MGSWLTAITQGAGRLGSEAGQSVDQNLELGLKTIQSQLMQQQIKEGQQRIALEEQRLKQSMAPQPQGVYQGPSGAAGVTFDPTTGKYGSQQIEGVPSAGGKTADQMWADAIQRDTGKPPTVQQLQKHFEETHRNAVDSLLDQANQAWSDGNTELANYLYNQAHRVAGARKAESAPSLFSTISKAVNQKDPESIATLKEWQKIQGQLAQQRGAGFGAGRAMFTITPFFDETGQLIPMTNYDAAQAIHAGRQLTPGGRLSPLQVIAGQRLISETNPAIQQIRQHVSTFDNPTDRAIFARVLERNPALEGADSNAWFGKVLDQALQEGLSPDGRSMTIALRRINESLGTMRQAVGQPATQSMTAMTIALAPGPTTPDAAYAKEQLDTLQSMVDNAVQVPVLRNAVPSGPGGGNGNAPPPGAKVLTYDPSTGTVK